MNNAPLSPYMADDDDTGSIISPTTPIIGDKGSITSPSPPIISEAKSSPPPKVSSVAGVPAAESLYRDGSPCLYDHQTEGSSLLIYDPVKIGTSILHQVYFENLDIILG